MKYKYKIIPVEFNNTPKLMAKDEGAIDNLGKDGWELVAVVPIAVKGNTEGGLAYFKHAISDKLDF
jgi:Domain of unknown function (DUF4177)